MEKKIKRIFSVLIICCTLLFGVGITSFAAGTSGTNDASLASLEISPGTLSPEFSSDVYEYQVEVDADCDKLLVNAKTSDSGAKMVIAGNSGLKVGTNTVIINVTAADGVTTAKYTIQAVRSAGEPQSSAAGSESTAAESSESQIANNPLVSSSGTAAETGSTEGQESQSSSSASAGTITTTGKTYTLSEPDASAIPDGYTAMDLKIGEQTVKVWKFPSEYDVEGFYLLYGTDEAGKTAFYIYDETEGTVITAPDGILSAGQENEISQVQLQKAQEAYQKSMKNRMLIIIGLSVLCFILLIAFTAAMTRRKNGHGEDDFHDDGPRGGYGGEPDEDDYEEAGEEPYDEEPYGEESYEEEPYDEEPYEEESYGEESYEEEPNEEESYGEASYDEELYDLDAEDAADEEPARVSAEEHASEPETDSAPAEEEESYPEEVTEKPSEEYMDGAESEDYQEEEETEQPKASDEEEEDLDADFDLLEALLSDSVRSVKPDDADSIVNRAAEKAGKRPKEQPVPVPEKQKVREPEKRERKKQAVKPQPARRPSQNLEDDDDFEIFDL
ncbi:cadherin-like beta sandwich domain-containing protein [Qiania dongpingensis]|uniref:Cadherin-like beta sandwich domain-containing protein n=1 Tax=Qiania dongpingensis TaxID=2763669 RepID=A0A7G9G2P4_9FIRM|nr:cadherin-like beta sandwich domain-containing protein [Qiania dongpingensis]QNM05076.1 cadherin-like beta sandwich domain-containing protein [Qiania dongpingensis]